MEIEVLSLEKRKKDIEKNSSSSSDVNFHLIGLGSSDS